MKITMYVKPNCPQCVQTKTLLKMRGVDESNIEMIDLTQSPDALTMVKAKGFTQAPVVNAGEMWWGGFSRTHIDSLFPVAVAA